MSRSIWKNNFLDHAIIKNLRKKKIIVWSRRSTVPYALVNKIALVHDGRTFRKVYVERSKVGFKFGEFVPTRKRWTPKKKKLKKK